MVRNIPTCNKSMEIILMEVEEMMKETAKPPAATKPLRPATREAARPNPSKPVAAQAKTAKPPRTPATRGTTPSSNNASVSTLTAKNSSINVKRLAPKRLTLLKTGSKHGRFYG